MTHICVSKITIIGLDNDLSPGRRHAIIWTNARILFIGPLGTNHCQSVIGIQTFSFKKMHLKLSSAKWRPFCLGLNVLTKSSLLHSPLGIIGSVNGLSPFWWQASSWPNNDVLSFGSLETSLVEISNKNHKFQEHIIQNVVSNLSFCSW